MEDKVKEIDREIDDLTREFTRFTSRFAALESKVGEIHRELGVREGRDLSTQVNELESKVNTMYERMAEVVHDTKSTRKLVEYGDIRLKEIMQALSLIYRNTDELEGNLLEAENIQTK